MRGVGESAFHNLFPVGYRQLAKDHLDIAEDNQGSEKWGRIFPDKAKSHGQFGAKTTYKTDGQTEKQKDRQPDIQIQTVRQSEDIQKDTWTDS